MLIYGPDNGLVAERARVLVSRVLGAAPDPMAIVDLDTSTISKDKARLFDEVMALSLMRGDRVVRVRDAGDSVSESVSSVLESASAGHLVVLLAGDLAPRSRLRSLAEKAANAAAIPCYRPEGAGIAELVDRLAREAGKRLEPEAAAYLGQRLAADHLLARREVEKLVTYAGEAGTITLADAQVAIGDSAEDTLDDVVMAAGLGDLAALDRGLDRLAGDGVAAVTLLRAGQRHFGRLQQALAAVAAGRTIEDAMKGLRPPVFFKQVPAFRRQLSQWSPAGVADALDRLVDAEAAAKRTGQPADLLAQRVLLGIAVEARRKR
ncbi:MAG: DNA polymerase III subunit delta [Azospirillaceae bacterium]